MKYCTHCGAEIEDEATICVHCGCATNENKPKTQNNTLGKVALIFMIIGCVASPFSVLKNALDLLSSDQTALFGIILLIFAFIPLAWCIPMTIHFSRKYKNGESVGTGFKVCTLLFVNLIAGIIMLCMPSENKNNN